MLTFFKRNNFYKFKIVLLSLFTVLGFQIKQTKSQNVEVFDFDNFYEYIESQNSNILVINFWATWCRPCIKEMPIFQEIHNNYNNDSLKVILVSLDFINHLENRVIPFIKERNIQSQVILLDDTDYNSWINKVDKNWQGEIPFTWIKDKKNNKNIFLYGEITKEQITNTIDLLIKN